MRRYRLFGPALGAALLSLPALAQPASQPMHPPGLAQETTAAPGAVAPAAAAREAVAADRMSYSEGPMGWLKEAEDALRRGHVVEANELLERAETRVLSRATPAPLADRPMQGPLLEHSAAARAALAARDRNGAMQQIRLAMSAARDMGDNATGSGAGASPAQAGSGLRQGMGGGMMGPEMRRDGRSTAPASPMLRHHGAAGGRAN